jgi:hypothetical protein
VSICWLGNAISNLFIRSVRNPELDQLGNTELVLSNHKDVISLDCVEGQSPDFSYVRCLLTFTCSALQYSKVERQ